MKKSKFFTGAQKEKASIIAASVFVLSALTLTGVYFSTKEEPQEENLIDFAKNTETKEETVEEKKEEKQLAKVTQIPENRYVDLSKNSDMDAEPSYTEVVSPEVINEEASVIAEEEEITETKVYTFGPEETLQWPIVGSVLVNFSMDKAVYFETMQQYRYSPAVSIAAKEGETVTAAADGIVKKISTEAMTGNTVVISLGSGYELTYGQLTDITVQEGDAVEAGAYIGKIAAPTIYYTEEGCNLYVALTKDGVPVNPFDYAEE